MRVLLRLMIAATAAALACAAVVTLAGLTQAQGQIRVTGDITAAPRSPLVHLGAIPASDAPIPADTAIRAALAHFKLSKAQLDPNATAVRALVNVPGDRLKHNIRAWVVTADLPILDTVLGHKVLYQTLSVVINADTGRYEFAYAGDPSYVGTR